MTVPYRELIEADQSFNSSIAMAVSELTGSAG